MTRVPLKEHIPLFNRITDRFTRPWRICTAVTALSCMTLGAHAQKVALKSNLLYDAAATVNAGVEVGIAPRWTLDVSGNLNAWDMPGGRKWKHWLAQPEARYWLCERFGGHFVALHAMGGQFNIGGLRLTGRNSRYQGWMAGMGFGYGYAWALGRHWSVEGEVCVGYAYSRSDRFECRGCGRRVEQGWRRNHAELTKAAINLVYVF